MGIGNEKPFSIPAYLGMVTEMCDKGYKEAKATGNSRKMFCHASSLITTAPSSASHGTTAPFSGLSGMSHATQEIDVSGAFTQGSLLSTVGGTVMGTMGPGVNCSMGSALSTDATHARAPQQATQSVRPAQPPALSVQPPKTLGPVI